MPDDYDKLKRELLEELKKVRAVTKKAAQSDKEIPGSVVYKLCLGAICALNAEKKLSKGKREEAVKEMQKATNYVNPALSDVSRIISPGQDLFERKKAMENGKGRVIIYRPIIFVVNADLHNLETTSARPSTWKHKVKKILLWFLNRVVEAIIHYILTGAWLCCC